MNAPNSNSNTSYMDADELIEDEQEHQEALGEALTAEDMVGLEGPLERTSEDDARRSAFNGLFRFHSCEQQGGYGLHFDHVIVETMPMATNGYLSMKTGDIKFYDSQGGDVGLLNIFKPDGWKK